MSEIKALKPMQRVKVLSPPKTAWHPLNFHVGYVVGLKDVRRNAAGTVIEKLYEIRFGNSSIRVIDAKYLWPMTE